MTAKFSENYRPIYFLSALGMGGLSVSFFMYLMFLVPHPKSAVPTSSDLVKIYQGGNMVAIAFVTLALAGITYFAVRHFQLLSTAIRHQLKFQKSKEYSGFLQSNAEVQLMAIPLTLGMTINVLFILAALAIPGMWEAREYVFPFALIADTAVGYLALKFFGRYITRILVHGSFNIDDTNHFSQVLPSFAFAMVAVAYAAAAAMSHTLVISLIGMAGSVFFLAAAASWIAVKLPVAFGSMLRSGMNSEAGPTLWLGIPIFTLGGISVFRLLMGTMHNITHGEMPAVVWLIFFGSLLAAQLVMGLFGWAVMHAQGYFARYVWGEKKSIPSYGLICPGVALAVLAHFFVARGLVANGIIEKFSVIHIALLVAIFAIQVLTIWTVAKLNAKLLGAPQPDMEEKEQTALKTV
ncbi:MAG: hypothetical protein CSA82_01940 [Actinobacteria bacterium]|nr:MAG: hypothetical protein CSA82_01940 [Actinomycetota bacterium]